MSEYSPMKQLASAVIYTAVKDVISSNNKSYYADIRRDALKFLCGEESHNILQFWCSHAGMNANAIMTKARKVRDGKEVFYVQEEPEMGSPAFGGFDPEGVGEAGEAHVGADPA